MDDGVALVVIVLSVYEMEALIRITKKLTCSSFGELGSYCCCAHFEETSDTK